MLPAWVKEPAAPADRYAHHQGESDGERRRHGRDRGPRDRQGLIRKRPTLGTDKPRGGSQRKGPRDRRSQDRHRELRQPSRAEDRRKPSPPIAPPIAVKFLPHPPAFENVVAQIKSDALTYSLFALARLF